MKVVYRRSSDYRSIAHPWIEAGSATPGEPRVNLADYWDYLEGLVAEALQAHALERPPPLRRLSVFATERCNLGCGFCKVDSSGARSIPRSWLERNVPIARSMGAFFLDIMGLGEPTMLEDLPELLQLASREGMVGTVGTNGATANLLDDRYLGRLFAASPLKFRVSLDSADPQEHDRGRGSRGSWEHTVRFIRTVAQARERGRVRCGLFVNKLLTASNAPWLLRDLEFMAGLGVDDIHLIPIRYATQEFFDREQIRRYRQELVPAIRQLGERQQLAWLRLNANVFGEDEADWQAASRGTCYQPTIAAACHVQRGQLLVDPCLRPYTCLWGRRAGGRPIPVDPDPELPLDRLRARLLEVDYLGVNPEICARYCTRRIIEANDRVARGILG